MVSRRRASFSRRQGIVLLVCAMLVSLIGLAADPAKADPVRGGAFVAVSPARLVDTRSGVGLVGAVPPGTSRSFQVTGREGVPSTGVAAVMLSVKTMTNGADGQVRLWASGAKEPSVYQMRFTAGQSGSNSTITRVGSDGKITLTVDAAVSVDLLIDVQGYFSPRRARPLTGGSSSRSIPRASSRPRPSVPVRPAPSRCWARGVSPAPTWRPWP
jgi:hypothetical protein